MKILLYTGYRTGSRSLGDWLSQELDIEYHHEPFNTHNPKNLEKYANFNLDKIKNCNVLVINCLRKENHATHFNLAEALHFISLVQPQKTYFTHISHKLGFHSEVSKNLPENVFLAYDGLKISVLINLFQ